MMKKRFAAVMVITCLLLLSACGSMKTADKLNDTDSSKQTKLEEKLDDVEPLDVENDEFTFENLVTMIGRETTAAWELIGAKESDSAVNTNIFGEELELKINEKGGVVKSFNLVFKKTKYEQLKNAVSEQLAQDGTEAEGLISWEYDGNTILLSVIEGNIVVDIFDEEENPADSQNPV